MSADYSNPVPPEDVNNSERNPLRELLWLTGGVVGILVLAILLLGLAAQAIAPMIPFRYEQAIAEPAAANLIQDPGDADAQRIRVYLASLAARVARAQGPTDEMQIQVHYADTDTVNAFATLGGHIVVHRGLLERLPHENALVMVLSHEIAHIRHRDPIVALGRGVVVGVALAALAGVSSNTVAEQLVAETGQLTALGFSRAQERAADAAGMAALVQLYGHTAGAADLYRALDESALSMTPAFFRTHPGVESRIDRLHALARSRRWPVQGETTPLPDWLDAALAAAEPSASEAP